MKKSSLVLCLLLAAHYSFSVDYFVATNGSDTNTGTSAESPLASLTTALAKAGAGDVIWVRGGTYPHSTTLSLTQSGTQTDTLFLLAYPGEHPVLDFSGTAFGKRGMTLSGNYWKIKGFEMKNAGDNALNISGGNNTIENCSFHDNKDTGLQLGKGAHDNQIINCDSYFNADPTDYGDADGFAPKLDVGSNNYFYGCRAWYNVDDGWDGYMRGNNDVTTVLENCWTWGNGYFKDGTDGGEKANGNGFKVGGSDDKNLKHNFTLINCLAFYNKAKGFDQNNNKGSMFFYNCTGYGNKGNDYSIPLTLASGKTAEIKNCVLYNGKRNVASFVDQERNSWDTRFSVDASDFLSVDTTGISGPRKSDGSLPDVEFMHLAPGSDLINAGIDLGFPYLGIAPDLGAFETTIGVGVPHQLASSGFRVFQSGSQSISLRFGTDNTQTASVSIYRLNGQQILTKNLNAVPEGMHETVIDAPLPAGFYLVRLRWNGQSQTAKLLFD